MGLEPTTPRITILCANQLRHTHHVNATNVKKAGLPVIPPPKVPFGAPLLGAILPSFPLQAYGIGPSFPQKRSSLMKSLLALFLTMGLVACSSDSSSSSGDGSATTVSEFGKSPEDIPVVTTLNIRLADDSTSFGTVETSCARGEIATGDTSYIPIAHQNDTLILFATDCVGNLYKGSGTALSNTVWAYVRDVPVPGTFCEEVLEDSVSQDLLGSSLVFGAGTLQHTSQIRSFCWASQHGEDMLDSIRRNNRDSLVTLVHYGCDQVNITVGSDQATVILDAFNASTTAQEVSFQFEGESCRFEKGGIPTLTAETCSTAYALFTAAEGENSFARFDWREWPGSTSNWDDFVTCVANLGWKHGVRFLN